MNTNHKRWLLTSVFLGLACGLQAETVTGWRTDGTGKYPNTNPPTEWSTSKHVIWSTSLPDWGNSSPVVSKGRVFVCAEPSTLVCLSATEGKILWQKPNTYSEIMSPAEVAKAEAGAKKAEALTKEVMALQEELIKVKRESRKAPEDKALSAKAEELKKKVEDLKKQRDDASENQLPSTHPENGYTSCTPVTDGKFVYALFGNGIAVCYDLDGNRKWIKLVEKPTAGWGQSSSPCLVGNKLLVLINNLTALNADTGEQLWRTPAQQRWGTPISVKIGDTDVAVTPSGDFIRVADGKVLASRVSDLTYCAPIVEDGVVYFVQHNGKAVKLPSHNSDTIEPEVLWQTTPPNERYYASPILHKGLIFATTQHGDFSVIDAKTGKPVHQRKLDLGGTAYSSITLAGDLLYVSGEGGKTLVLKAETEAKEVAQNQLERLRSSPVFIGDRMYIKTREKLYCIGKK